MTLIGTNTTGQRGSGINGNEGLLYIPKFSITGTSSSNAVWSHILNPSFNFLGGGSGSGGF